MPKMDLVQRTDTAPKNTLTTKRDSVSLIPARQPFHASILYLVLAHAQKVNLTASNMA